MGFYSRHTTIALLSTIVIITLISFSFRKNTKEPETAAQLGEMLFFDPILSSDKTISCASCHKPEFGFADTMAFSIGVGGKPTKRNTLTVMNVLSHSQFFWDGRVSTLEEQALHPISNPDEMNLPLDKAVKRLKENNDYKHYFLKIFNSEPTKELLGKAIAAFENTLETSETKFDRYMSSDSLLFSESEERGRKIFNEKADCFECHFSPDFTGDEYRNIGLYNGKNLNDKGRFDITQNKNDIGKFKVPGLRNVAITAPYMHNGMFSNLRQVIDYYNSPDSAGFKSINRDAAIRPLHLTEQEKQDLEAFLLTLTDERFLK